MSWNAPSLNPLIQRVAFSSDYAACTVAAHPTRPPSGRGRAWANRALTVQVQHHNDLLVVTSAEQGPSLWTSAAAFSISRVSSASHTRGFGPALQHPRQIVFIFASNFEFSTASMSTTVPCSSVGVLDAAGVHSLARHCEFSSLSARIRRVVGATRC